MFYQSDSISRVMPGKADCITVKDPVDNTPHTLQKRHMVMTVNEAVTTNSKNTFTISRVRKKLQSNRKYNA